MSQGLDKNFVALMDAMREQARRFVAAIVDGAETPRWDDYSHGDTDSPAYFDREATRKHFDVEQAQQMYANAMAGEDGFNERRCLVAAKLQSDLINQVERDFKMRRMTRIRAQGIETSRRARHAHLKGPIARQLRQAPQGVLDTGNSSDS